MNKISNIKVLSKVKFPKLEKLYLAWNKIYDITILKKVNFTKLKELDLSKTIKSLLNILFYCNISVF